MPGKTGQLIQGSSSQPDDLIRAGRFILPPPPPARQNTPSTNQLKDKPNHHLKFHQFPPT
jgi:hypothetical protein